VGTPGVVSDEGGAGVSAQAASGGATGGGAASGGATGGGAASGGATGGGARCAAFPWTAAVRGEGAWAMR